MTYFDVSGNVGRVTKREYNGKKVTYISVASVSFYKGKTYTTWINNVAFYGPMADVVSDIVTAGAKIRVSGVITTKIKNKIEHVFFIGEKFELQTYNEEKRQERLQQQAVNNLPDDEDVYASPESGDDLPY
jgi:single-stranded DNA-binding protein